MITNLTEYQKFTETTAIYPATVELDYITSGLFGELGEMAQIYKRWVRDGNFSVDLETIDELRNKNIAEAGDVLWYSARYCQHFGMNLNDIIGQAYSKWDEYPEKDTVNILTVGEIMSNLAVDFSHIITESEKAIDNTCNRGLEKAFRDLFFELIALGSVFEFTIKEVYQANVVKLSSRKENNTLKGSGDDR